MRVEICLHLRAQVRQKCLEPIALTVKVVAETAATEELHLIKNVRWCTGRNCTYEYFRPCGSWSRRLRTFTIATQILRNYVLSAACQTSLPSCSFAECGWERNVPRPLPATSTMMRYNLYRCLFCF